MATTITTPAPYSSVKKSVVFGIQRPLNSVCEVTVNGYKKLLPNDTRQVNVSRYYWEDFDIAPNVDQEQTFVVCSGSAWNRVTEAYISVDGVESSRVPLICADRTPRVGLFMSDLRRRTIDRGQVDELPVYLAAPATLAFGAERVSLSAGISFVGFRVPSDAPEHFPITLLSSAGIEQDRIEYRIEALGGVRLAWINAYGAVDCWNFQNRRKTQTKITKEKIYSDSGYTSTSIKAETTQTVTTQALPEQTLIALSQLFTAERTWSISGDSAQPIDITTESTGIYEAEKPCSVQVEYKTKIRQL